MKSRPSASRRSFFAHFDGFNFPFGTIIGYDTDTSQTSQLDTAFADFKRTRVARYKKERSRHPR